MRQTGCKSGFIAVMIVLLLLYGCGSDIMDEEGLRYTAVLEVEDNGDGTLQVDTIQDMCEEEPEDFSDALATVKVTVAQGAPGITLKSYSIEYIPLPSADGSGVLVQPPALIGPLWGYSTFSIKAGGTGDLPITLMSVDTKNEFNIKMGWLFNSGAGWVYYPPEPDELQMGRYTVRVTLYFEDQYSGKRTIFVDRTVYLSNYDNC